MTIEEKLEKAIEFIKSIEQIDVSKYDAFDVSDIEAQATGICEECGDEVDDIKLVFPHDI